MNQSSYTPESTGRFVFDEDFFFKKMITIAKRFDLKFSYKTSQSWDSDKVLWYEAVLTGKYNFELSFRDDMISITPVCFNDYNHYKYVYSYSFVFLDDAFVERKACEYEYSDQDLEYFEHIVFSSDILFCGLSNDEIFDIVEKIIEALYGAKSMNYETIKADDGKESFIFYLDAPDYYGYTETTEIGNFKFILNKENGGN